MSSTETILARLDTAQARGFDAYSAEYDRLENEYGQDAIRQAVFSRRAQTPAAAPAQPTTDPTVIGRFGTLLGATVVLTKRLDAGHTSYRWTCEGCQDNEIVTGYFRKARDGANGHAATCRSLPAGPAQ